MSRMKRTHQADMAANGAWDRARLAAAQVKPVTAQLRPLARTAGAAGRRRVHTTRAWAAPQAERMARLLRGSVTPKVSALLSSAARRLEPAKPRRRPGLKLAAIAVLAAAASAAAALVLNRRKPEVTTSAVGAAADGLPPAAQMRDGQARTSGGGSALPDWPSAVIGGRPGTRHTRIGADRAPCRVNAPVCTFWLCSGPKLRAHRRRSAGFPRGAAPPPWPGRGRGRSRWSVHPIRCGNR